MFDVPEPELPTVAELVAEEMAAVRQLRVPLVVDVKTGGNWAICE